MSGFCMVLFLAGMQKIPADLYDSARVDGANPVQEFFAVTLPGLRYELSVALVITAIVALRNFDHVFNLTRGGPGYSTSVPSYEVYFRAFAANEVGRASALAIAIAFAIFVIAVLVSTFTENER